MRYLDKDQLRRDLPLAYVCEFLGIDLDAQGRGVCPFHDDHDPSLQLRQDEDGIDRWHCWPCGFGGDVFDLLQRAEGMSFPDSIIRAEELFDQIPVGWSPKFQLPDSTPAETAEDWAPLIERGKRHALENNGMLCVAAGLMELEDDEAERRRVDHILRDEFKWGVDDEGNVIMPHFTTDGQLTAIKLRSMSGFKWGRPGSRYVELYGSWLPQRHRNLLLCEGESDAVWARLQDPQVDVRALPSGAQTTRDRFFEQVKQWDRVYLAFDADRSGISATRTWLEGIGAKALVCRLPRGHDLRSARPSIKEMLEHAITPTPIPGAIQVQNDRFEKVMQQGQRPLTSWWAEPIARLVPSELDEGQIDPALEVEVNYAGRKDVDLMTAQDMMAGRRMREWAGKRSLDCLMSDGDAQLMQSYLTAQAQILPDVFMTPRVGIHEPPNRYRYAGRSLVTPDTYIGRLPWRFVGPPELHGQVKLDDDGPINWDWLRAALQLNHESVMHPLLAWLAATVRRTEVKQFPLFFVGGASGAGKSTIVQLLCRMFGSQMSAQLGAITAFPLLRLLSSSTTIPVFIDEWSRQSRHDTREAFQGALPLIYEGGIAERGRPDQTVVQYRTTSPVVVAGEDTFALDREEDRMCSVELARAGQNHEALQVLVGQPLERFGYWYSRWALDASDLPPMPDPRHNTRPGYNRAVLEAGWLTLRRFLDHAAQFDPNTPELSKLPDLSAIDERREVRENEYQALIREALGQNDSSGVEVAWVQPGVGTWVRFRALTSKDFMRKLDIDLPGGSRAMQRYFEGQGYEIESRRVQLPFSRRVMFASLVKGYDPLPDEEVHPALEAHQDAG